MEVRVRPVKKSGRDRSPNDSRWKRVVIASVACICLTHVLAVGALGAAGAEDQIVSKFVGKNWVNGRSWQKLEYAGKLGYVCGLFDGMTLFYSVAENDKKGKSKGIDSTYGRLAIPSTLTVGDVVFGMDDFYKEPENIELPAVCAYLHFVYQSRGENHEVLANRLKTWRRMFIQ